MDRIELSQIKKKALEDHIPIIMDDTLEVVAKILQEVKPNRILEIGTATRLLSHLLFRIFEAKWKNRYYRT